MIVKFLNKEQQKTNIPKKQIKIAVTIKNNMSKKITKQHFCTFLVFLSDKRFFVGLPSSLGKLIFTLFLVFFGLAFLTGLFPSVTSTSNSSSFVLSLFLLSSFTDFSFGDDSSFSSHELIYENYVKIKEKNKI